MSDDWEAVTKIGSKVRGTGVGQHEKTVKGKSALNAAQRSGAVVATEKKFSSANASGGPDGQLQAKLDREELGTTKRTGAEVAKACAEGRTQLKDKKGKTMSREQLAKDLSIDKKIVDALETPDALFPQEIKAVNRIEDTIHVYLTGSNVGSPKLTAGQKAAAKREEAAKKAAGKK